VSLIGGLESHAETLAIEYVRELRIYGKPLEDGIVKRGISREFLHCLEAIGEGTAIPQLIFLDPAKRIILQTASIPTQKDVVKNGVNGKPLDKVVQDVLRAYVGNSKPRAKQKKSEKTVPVASHARAAPTPGRGKDKTVVGGRSVPWHDIITTVCKGLEADLIPEKEVARLLRSVDEYRKKH